MQAPWKIPSICSWLVAAALAVCQPRPVCGDEAQNLRTQLQTQEKARGLALALVAEVLDVQLRQLEENGLGGQAMYRDVEAMRASLEALTGSEMQQIADLLAAAERLPPTERGAPLAAARNQVRNVVSQLMAQRQKLYRRMQVTRVAQQARELSTLQAKTLDMTRSLSDLPSQNREQLALSLLEDQADVAGLYADLTVALADVGSWGGPAADAAQRGLTLLRAAGVQTSFQAVASDLQEARYPAASKNQQSILQSLAALQEVLDEAQGSAGADRETALRMVREVLTRQSQARQAALAGDSRANANQVHLNHQTDVHKSLARLASPLGKFPQTHPLLEQAKAASMEAMSAFFEEQPARAAQGQARAMASLAQIESFLHDDSAGSRHQSADELAALAARLQQLQRDVEPNRTSLTQAAESSADQPADSLHTLDQVEQRLTAADQQQGWPTTVATRLEQSVEATSAAAKTLGNGGAAPAERLAAIRHSQAALKFLLAEIEVQLADTLRRQRAVQLGELARAAEALERASSAERLISRHLQLAAAAGRLTEPHAAILLQENADVAAISERLAVGIAQSAPHVAADLQGNGPRTAAVSQAIEAIKTQLSALTLPALGRASEAALALASKLTEQAAALREAQRKSARELELIAAEQFSAAQAVREAVQQAIPESAEQDLENVKQFDSLQKSLDAARQSLANATGQDAWSKAIAALHAVRELIAEEHRAANLSREWASGLNHDPLAAASAYKSLADRLAQSTVNMPAEIAAAFKLAATEGDAAAKDLLVGNPAKVAAQQTAVKQHLAEAEKFAKSLVDKTRQPNSTFKDDSAQTETVARWEELVRLADQLRTAMNSPNEERLQAITQALQSRASSTPDQLADAIDQVQKLSHELARDQLDRQQSIAEKATQLAERAASIDPSAAASLAQAGSLAERSNAPSNESLARSQQKLQQALGNLAAREQQLRDDRDLAHALGDLAAQQQAARESIQKAAADLESADPAQSAQRMVAAQELMRAQQQFALTQMATGEGAAKVSGQEQVANEPIREGLEIASGLHRPLPSDADVKAHDATANAKTAASDQAAGQPSSDAPPPDEAQSSAGNNQLGTGLVPASPQVTAQQIAGPAANAAAASAMSQMMQGMAQGEGQPGQGQGQSETNQQGETSATAQKGGAPKKASSSPNEATPAGDLEKAEVAAGDSRANGTGTDAVAAGPSGVQAEPWFSKLPPQIRSAIQAKARGQAPRGYAERLRRYFESVD